MPVNHSNAAGLGRGPRSVFDDCVDRFGAKIFQMSGAAVGGIVTVTRVVGTGALLLKIAANLNGIFSRLQILAQRSEHLCTALGIPWPDHADVQHSVPRMG